MFPDAPGGRPWAHGRARTRRSSGCRSGRPSSARRLATVERRGTDRREEDRLAREEATLLARVLDILAADTSAERRLAGRPRSPGRDRRSPSSGGPLRRSRAPGRGHGRDDRRSRGPVRRPRARCVARRQRPAQPGRTSRLRARGVSIVRGGLEPVGPVTVPGDAGRAPDVRFASLDIPAAGRVTLGFEMDDEDGVLALAQRLPPTLARHAAVALALVTGQLAASAELESLRAHESERERFVSTVAHDLRSPLTGLGGYLDLILGQRVTDPEVVGEFLERSRRIVESMTDLVGDLLEISKLDAGNLRLEIAPVLGGRGRRAGGRRARSDRSRPAGRAADRSAAADAGRGRGPPSCGADLTNLLANALKFGGQGGTVEVAGRFDGPVAVLAVRDDGPGIEAGRAVADLRTVLPDQRPRSDRRDRSRAGDRPRPGPGDARRPRPWRPCPGAVRASSWPCPDRPVPSRTTSGDPRASGRRGGGPTRGGRRPSGDPRLGSGTGSRRDGLAGERGAVGPRRRSIGGPTDLGFARSTDRCRSSRDRSAPDRADREAGPIRPVVHRRGADPTDLSTKVDAARMFVDNRVDADPRAA